jgi:hypothetical protein
VIDGAIAWARRCAPRLLRPSFAAPDAVLVERERREQPKLAAREKQRAAAREGQLIGANLERSGYENRVMRQVDGPMFALLSLEVVIQL